MPHDVRTDQEETPEGRIAAAAYAIFENTIANYAKTGHGPKRPDRADFRDGLQLYVQRELVTVKLEVIKAHGTFPAALELQRQLNIINWQIAKKENP